MSYEAEKCVIAAIVKSARAFEIVDEIVSAEDFLDLQLRFIFTKVASIRETGSDVDIVSLSATLDRSSSWLELQPRSDARTILEDILFVARSFRDTKAYAQIVHDAALTRRLVEYSEDVRDLALDGDLSSDEKLGRVNEALSPLTAKVPSGFVSYANSATKAMARVRALKSKGEQLSGKSTGYDVIDETLSGLQDGELTIVGARPSMGKTIFGLGIADHVAKSSPVLVYSLEMSRDSLANRTLSKLSGVNFRKVSTGRVSDEEEAKLEKAQAQISKLNLQIDDSAGLHIDQIRTRTRVAARREKPGLILIDYLTLIRNKGDNMHQMVGDTTKSLKAMAKEFSCPVVCLAQLNRSLEQRADKRPTKSDLRESGSIEEDADVIMFLYRDEVYDEETERSGILEVDIAKNRNGPIGVRYLKSELQYQRFTQLLTSVPPLQKMQSNNKAPFKRMNGAKQDAAINDAEAF